MTEYYILRYTENSIDSYLIWYTNDNDGVLLEDNKVLSFDSCSALFSYADKISIKIAEANGVVHDLDSVCSFVDSHDDEFEVDSKNILNCINLFRDVSSSVKGINEIYEILINEYEFAYDKLFWANNPKSLIGSAVYEPIWSEEELLGIRVLLEAGLDIFRRNVRSVGVT